MKIYFQIIITTLSIILFFTKISNAQSYTSIISSPEDDSPMAVCADHLNGFYLLTWRGINDPYATDPPYFFDNFRNVIYQFDGEISIVDSIEIDFLGDYDWSLWDLVIVGDSLLAWGTTYNEVNESCHLGLLWLDENLQVVDYKIHGDYSDSVQFVDFSLENHGNMIFAGFHGWTKSLHLIKTDQGGNLVMDNSIPLWGNPYPNICYLPANDQIMCGAFSWIGYINNSDFTVDTFYLPEIFTGGFFGDGGFVRYNESSAIMPGLASRSLLNIAWNFGCIIFDSIAQVCDSVVFNTTFDLNSTSGVEYNTTDSILFGGIENTDFITVPEMFNFDPIDRRYFITMFNFDGYRYWTLHLGGEANYSLMCLTILKNNACLVAGARYDWRNNPELERDIYLYKIDPDGTLVGVPETTEEIVSIYPNPGSDIIHIQASKHDLKFYLYDLAGRKVLTSNLGKGYNTVPVNWIPPGLYVYQIKGEASASETKGKWLKAK